MFSIIWNQFIPFPYELPWPPDSIWERDQGCDTCDTKHDISASAWPSLVHSPCIDPKSECPQCPSTTKKWIFRKFALLALPCRTNIAISPKLWPVIAQKMYKYIITLYIFHKNALLTPNFHKSQFFGLKSRIRKVFRFLDVLEKQIVETGKTPLQSKGI